jgi:multidrug efflux pump subunit AcrB
MIESQLPEIKYIRFISSMSANGRVVAYFSVEPIFAQLTQQQLQQLQQRGEQRVPESWVYRLVFTSTDFQNTVYKVVDLKKLDEAKLLDK